jgi:hypothetical protein
VRRVLYGKNWRREVIDVSEFNDDLQRRSQKTNREVGTTLKISHGGRSEVPTGSDATLTSLLNRIESFPDPLPTHDQSFPYNGLCAYITSVFRCLSRDNEWDIELTE